MEIISEETGDSPKQVQRYIKMADYKMSRPNVQKILYKNVQLVCLS